MSSSIFSNQTSSNPMLPSRHRALFAFTLFALTLGTLLGASSAQATVCKVSTNGSYPYLSVADALVGGCNGSDPAGDQILVVCESGGCVQPPFQIVGRNNLQVSVQGDPTTFENPGGGGAIYIEGSTAVVIEGAFDATSVHDPAVWILKSDVTLEGHPSERYATFHAQTDAALQIVGASHVTLDTIALRESVWGIRTQELYGEGPKITGRQMNVVGNENAGLISGGTSDCGDPSAPIERSEVTFELSPDFQPNYVEQNLDGFIVEGNSILTLRHTILLANLRQSDVMTDTALLRGRGCGTINAQQILAFDNDPWSDAGADITNWWPSGDGAIVKTEEYSNAVIESSTLVHNQMEFGMWPTTLKGSITFHSSVADQTGIKGVPCSSGYFFSDGFSSVYGSGLSDYDGCYCNYFGPVPPPNPICPPSPLNISVDPGGWDVGSVFSTSPWPALPKQIYRMHHSPFIDGGPGAATPALFPTVPWATDQSSGAEVNGSPIDWGYHSF